MGTWGTQPFENDAALDIKSEWNDTKNITVLEGALDVVLCTDNSEYLDSMDAETSIAAVSLLLRENLSIDRKKRTDLLKKSAEVLSRTLKNSELHETWSETESFSEWLKSITNLMQQINDQLQKNESDSR
jgi:hypothetical protein